jgi:tripartite-type tricarboxylate transporter receptor subunit TctC
LLVAIVVGALLVVPRTDAPPPLVVTESPKPPTAPPPVTNEPKSPTITQLVHAPPPAPPANDYPTRTIRFVVPFPAGGATDVLSRIAAQHAAQKLGQTFIVENRVGAGGTIGMQALVTSPADGYTLGAGGLMDFVNRYLFRKLSYDPARDLVPIAMIGRQPSLLVAHPSVPAKTLKELVAHAKKNPGKLTYATSGNGTASQIGMMQLAQLAGIDLTPVSYRGIGPASVDMISGQVQLMHATAAPILSQVQSGRLRAFAVVSRERLEALPNVPTAAEAGFPGYDFEVWYGVVAPRHTPGPVVAKLSLHLRELSSDPEVGRRLSTLHMRPVSLSPQEIAAELNRELPKLEKLIRAGNIAVD